MSETESEWEREERQRQRAARRVNRRIRLERLGGLVDDEDIERIATNRLDPTTAVQRITAWSREDGPASVLVILGGVGTGKTFAALAWLAHVRAEYVLEAELVRLSRAAFGPDRARFVQLLEAHALVVDEVGIEPNDTHARVAMMALVDARKALRTVIVGNLTPAQFTERRTDARIRSRLRAYGELVVASGPSLRRDLGLFPLEEP